MTIISENVAQLTSMGFLEVEARSALQKTGGNLEMAVNRLLSGEGVGGNNINDDGIASSVVTISPFSNANDPSVRGSTSQYSYGSDGRSACTCIALTAAEFVANATTTDSETTIITTEFLDRAIQEGVARYIKLRKTLASSGTSSTGSNSVEHLSADEVLLKDDERPTIGISRLFDIQLSAVDGGQRVRQGALSRDEEHSLGMKSVLKGLVNDVRMERRQRDRQKERKGNDDGDSKIDNIDPPPMICILLTKSPETVLLCLPPFDYEHNTKNGSNDGVETPKKKYWLIDSHPRPQLRRGVENSYAKPHDTFDSLLRTIRNIFPFTDLGPDIPSTMSDFYNMFDLYALEGRKYRSGHK